MTGTQRHYEALLIANPEFSGNIDEILSPYRKLVESAKGEITRLENWGVRSLAYPIDKFRRGCYVLMNFSVADSGEVAAEIEKAMKANDPIIRSLISRTKDACTEMSPFMAAKKAQEEREKEAS